MKYWKISILGLGLLPLGFILSLLTFYFHAGIVLGYLPSYDYPDPSKLLIYRIYLPLIWITATIWLVSFMFWVILIVLYIIIRKGKINWKYLILTAIIQALAIILFKSRIWEWFVD
jgi:hypothetical protein